MSTDDLVQTIRAEYLKTFSDHLASGDGAPMYVTDLVMFGLMDRNIGLVEALPKLIGDENIHALAPLMRIQLDGLLRLHAFRLVKNPDELAHHVIRGEELRRFKDVQGNKLTDRHLVESLKRELPWVESMYDTLCGWVHFSEAHIFAAASEGATDRTLEIGIGGCRKRVNPEWFKEAVEATKAIHEATVSLIRAYFGHRGRA